MMTFARSVESISSKTETLFTVRAKKTQSTIFLDICITEWCPEWKNVSVRKNQTEKTTILERNEDMNV